PAAALGSENKNVRQVCDGGPRRRIMYLETVDSAISNPSLSSSPWRNHAEAIAAIDLCVVPTLTFERLFAFLVLGHGRRQLLWYAVTRHPTAEWLAQQILEAFPWNAAPTAHTCRPSRVDFGRW